MWYIFITEKFFISAIMAKLKNIKTQKKMTIDYIYMLFAIVHFNRRLAVEIHSAAFSYCRHSYRGDIISNTNIISQFKNK